MGDPQMNCRENAETSREFVFCFSKVGELLRNKRFKSGKSASEPEKKPQISPLRYPGNVVERSAVSSRVLARVP